ncbi:hypothetical protein PPL_07377 [Heterostelium album PN500]|uniref:EF-hand domain-containing protein n=1 Tax=Heterostelium pallidum (strain ATCC 26659 / Pp 5 / PN500) TaxID=670386 RepID=D3BFS6_HETP5|nr:hypothetical protein PPL_07377 [Heterostelium album PN500]EFA79686.1 hypothetical protein PPL_07377 [Heterostelium album PN500]|eukprot:XP_020431807.1 hypothetical protein PPL_07377 [Heterostelium album PN500]
MNQEHLSHLESIFNECDRNGSGFIDKDQLRELVTKITSTGLEEDELDTLMKTLDSDNDGKIALQEFINGYELIDPELLINDDNNVDIDEIDQQKIDEILNSSTVKLSSPEDYERYIRSIFNTFDTDGDGIVNKEQLREMLLDIKQKSDIEGDDEDIDYIVQVLSEGSSPDAISFDQFMSAIEHINSPSEDQSPSNSTIDFNSGSNGGNNNAHNDSIDEQDQQQQQQEDTEDLSSFSTSSSRKARNRASSWVAPVSIVQMIKKKSDLFEKQEIQEFTDASLDQSVVDQYKRKEAQLKSENLHLGSKINMVEDQLREVRESHEKLSEDNAQLKKSVVIEKIATLELQLAAANSVVKAQSSQIIIPPEEAEQLKSENQLLREQLKSHESQSSENIKLLTDECMLLKNQSKEDKARLESSNQIIHKLKATLEEKESRSHNSDPNYKLSLLSELEHQVVTRMGTPGGFEDSALANGERGNFSPIISSSTPMNTPSQSTPISISTNGRVRPETTSDDEDFSLEESNKDSSEWKEKYDAMVLQFQELQAKLESELATIAILREDVVNKEKQIGEINQKLEETNQKLQETNQKIEVTNQQLLDTNQKFNDTNQQLQDANQQLQDANQKFNDTNQQLQDANQKLQESSQQVSQLSLLNQNMNDTIASTSSTLELTNQHVDSLQSQVKDLEQRRSKLQDENQSLKNQQQVNLPQSIDPIHIKAEQTQSELSLLKQRVEELANTNNSLLNENSQLKNNFSPVNSTTELAAPTTSVNSSLAADVSDASLNTIDELQHQVTNLTAVKEQLEADLFKHQAQLAAATAAPAVPANNSLIDELKRENENLKTTGQKLDERNRILEYQSNGATEENNNLKQQLSTLNNNLQNVKLEYEAKMTNSEKKKLQKENDELKQRLKKYESEDHQHDIIEMEDEAKLLKARLEDLNSKLQNERNLNKYLQSQLDTQDRSINVDQTPLISHNKQKKSRQCCGFF